ncbi:MAG: hypothetical protein JWN12_826 [Candidatus Saccharibacteria bacterium]|nr:hypothetical protein [Candidatus Saccharibacteria bacterium]
MGFASSTDRGIIPLLKDLGFISADGAPLAPYHAYRDRSRSKAVMASALRSAYEDVFHIREIPTASDRSAVEGLFKSKHNSTDKVAQMQAMTFYALLGLADMKSSVPAAIIPESVKQEQEDKPLADNEDLVSPISRLNTELHYTIQVHLPATKDIEVFNAIFRSLRENLLS